MSLVFSAGGEGEEGPAGKRTQLLEEEENGERRRDADMQPTPSPLLVKRLSEHATLPARASPGAAGYDLYR